MDNGDSNASGTKEQLENGETPGKPEKMFTLKKWNAVAMWSWDVECDTCAICRVQVMDACLRCQSESKVDARGGKDCVVVWGECNHSFHQCCMSLWIKQNNRCPLCQQEWTVQKLGKCSADYCSVKCYQSGQHSSCTEQFYKECVTAELTGHNLSGESKRKMVEILNRMNRQEEEEEEGLDSDDEDSPSDLAERIEGLDLDDADSVWRRLTKEERRQFEELIKTGEAEKLVPEYEPWWKETFQCAKIQEVGNETEPDYRSHCPPVQPNIPSLGSLTNVAPSPLVKYGLLNLLYGYAYAVKFYAGDYEGCSSCEFVDTVRLLSSNLRAGHSFESADMALESAASQVGQLGHLAVSLEFSRQVKSDVRMLVRGPVDTDTSYYILVALSDLKRQLAEAKKFLKRNSEKQEAPGREEPRDLPIWKKVSNRKPDLSLPDLKNYVRKVEYYLSWVVSYPNELKF